MQKYCSKIGRNRGDSHPEQPVLGTPRPCRAHLSCCGRQISIDEGSLVLVATGLLAATALWADVARLTNPDSLGTIDPKRAAVVERWQTQSRNNPNRVYLLEDAAKHPLTTVTAQSDFKQPVDTWVSVEKYLHGKIMDWGGKTRPNIHIELENGKLLTVAATREQLIDEHENRLYRSALLHVRADENLRTGGFRNLILLSLEAHHPAYDEDEFQQMVRKGTAAWADVPNASQWVESLRSEET